MQRSLRLTSCLLLGAICMLTLTVSRASASRLQVAMFEADPQLYSAPASTLATLRSLGVGVIRVSVQWNKVLSGRVANPSRRPIGFVATDPGAGDYGFEALDQIVRDASADGITVDLSLTGGAPLWATGRGKPPGGSYPQWKPSAAAYGEFVQAVGARYSGSYRPVGGPALPRVSMWELWNEPNFGMDLAPQAIANSRVPLAAVMYRSLVDAGWRGLVRSNHSHDTVILGNLAARGVSGPPSRGAPQGYPGNFSATKPVLFVRQLYCVGANLRPLRGRAARVIGCPMTGAGSRRFAAQHPALFTAAGFGDHPYPLTAPPSRAGARDRDNADFAQLGHFASVLDTIQHAYRARHRFAIYNNEFGYITDPPNSSQRFPSPARAAAYLNWAEYLSWRNPRIASTMQYLLNDPSPHRPPDYGGFATGLRFYDGGRKPSYDAYRLPVFIATSGSHHRILVWGCARPARAFGNPNVAIEFTSGARGRFTRVATAVVRNPRGYFEAWITVRHAGRLRLAWTYPGGATAYSRTVSVSVR